MRKSIIAAIALPALALGACQVNKDEGGNVTGVEISGDAAANGTADALNGVSDVVDAAATEVGEAANRADQVEAGAKNVGNSVDNAVDSTKR